MTRLAWLGALCCVTALMICVSIQLKNVDLAMGASLVLFMGGMFILVKETY